MSKVSVISDAKAILGASEPVRLALVTSIDRTRRERFSDRFLSTFFKDSSSIESYDCRELDSESIKTISLRSDNLSLFSQRKIVFFRHVDSLSAKELKEITLFADQRPQDTYILFQGEKFPEKSLFLQYCRKHGAVIEFPELKGPELRRWIRKESALNGVSDVGDDAVELLCRLSEDNLDSLVHHISVAALYVEDGKITVPVLYELYRSILHGNDFEIADLLFDGQAPRARVLLAEALQDGRNPYGILSILGRLCGQVTTTRFETDMGTSLAQIREALGVAPWQFNKISTFARKNKDEALRNRLRKLLVTDSRLKSRSVHIADILDGALCGQK